MASTTTPDAPLIRPKDRLEVLFEELGELMGQRNNIDARIVDLVAEMDHDNLWGITGCRSIRALVAWKTGSSMTNANTIATIAHRLPQFPRCAQGMREGRLSLDQVGAIAKKAANGSDEHYAALAQVATVSQLNTALNLEPPLPPEPDPDRTPAPAPELRPSITKTHSDERYTYWKIALAHLDAATFDAALHSHLEAAIAEWKHDHDNDTLPAEHRAPFPTHGQAFLRLIESGWDAEATARPTDTGPPSSPTSTSKAGPHNCTWAHCSQTPTANTSPATPPARSGSTAPAPPSAPDAAPAPSTVDYAAPCNTATPPARYPVAAPPADCTPTTSPTGKTAAPPTWTTSSCAAPTITACTTAAPSPSPDPQTNSPSPTATETP